jgi:tRNA pseudouridine38-40 synthase
VARNLKLTLEFDGARYAGWQFQPNRPTVQGAVEQAMRKVVGADVTVYGCGRTDAGVSARRYVANLHAESPMTPSRLRAAVNHFLPEDIHVLAVEEAPPDFQARFSAIRKTYRYCIVRGPSPLRRGRAWEYRYPLDTGMMAGAARLFEGDRDFQPFCQTRDVDGRCMVGHVDVDAHDDEVILTVRGNRFLYKMVRRIVGAVAACGSGRLTQKDIKASLAGKPHTVFQTAPAQGLLLDSVDSAASTSRPRRLAPASGSWRRASPAQVPQPAPFCPPAT